MKVSQIRKAGHHRYSNDERRTDKMCPKGRIRLRSQDWPMRNSKGQRSTVRHCDGYKELAILTHISIWRNCFVLWVWDGENLVLQQFYSFIALQVNCTAQTFHPMVIFTGKPIKLCCEMQILHKNVMNNPFPWSLVWHLGNVTQQLGLNQISMWLCVIR